MSNYLGLQPTQRPDYYFISYNSEDRDRVGSVAKQLSYANMPIWYDYGLEYGEKWESQIADKIKNAQAVILFFTKGILKKENSYVRKEYEIATKYLNKKVYIVMVDKMERSDIPDEKVLWWVDIQERQIVDIIDMSIEKAVDKILEAAGISSHTAKMNMLIEKYRNLYDNGEKEEAERFLCEYLHGQNLAGKAQLVANLVCGGVAGSVIESSAVQMTEIKDLLLKEKLGTYPPYEIEDSFRITVKEDDFTILIREVSVPPSGATINAVQVLRGYDNIYIATNLRDAANLKTYYDSYDDVIFISVEGQGISEERVAGTYINIITVENPNGDAVCNTFRDVRLKK